LRGANIHDKNFALDKGICGDAACTTAGKIDNAGKSVILSGGIGWRFNQNLRADATVARRLLYDVKQTMPDATDVAAKVHSWSLMANGYYDFPMARGTPYVGAGLGWASNKVENVNFSTAGAQSGGSKSNPAWALMAGVGVPITPRVTLDVGYRYIDLGKFETGPGSGYSGVSGKLRAHELIVGFRF
jgi:opacity protein-like surface antigen